MKSAFLPLPLVLMVCGITLAQAPKPPVPAPAGPPTVRGKLDAVTVYRGQALVTRVVNVAGPGGLKEVIVSELPEAVVPASLYAEPSQGVEVRSVRYRVRPVAEDVREEVRKLDLQIQDVQDKLTANRRNQELCQEQWQYLGKLEQFVAPTATVELSKGVLNAQTLKDLTLMLTDQRQTVADKQLKLGVEARDLQQDMNLLIRQREELAGRSAKSAREAIVFVNVVGEGGAIRLRYLVNHANWTPSYNVRADGDRQTVRVEYNANIQQMSGEDWTDVTMTLSTATPSLIAMAPTLAPLAVSLRPMSLPGGKGLGPQRPMDYEESKRQLKGELNALAVQSNAGNIYAGQPAKPGQPANQPALQAGYAQEQRDTGALLDSQYEVNERFNRLADELQVLDLAYGGSVQRKSDGKAIRESDEEPVSVTYQVNGRTSLPSRADRQIIQIAAVPMKARFYKLAIPVLTNYVYEEAGVTNDGKLVLLAGPVSSYLGNEFVGLGQLPTVAVGENFTIGFGIDTALRATRELVEKKETMQGGNRIVDFTYRLAVENFGSAPAAVRVLDRLPTTTGHEVKITLGTLPKDRELSADETYQQTLRKKGILRWDVEVPAQAIGTKALAVEYSFNMEYDRQMTVGGMPEATRR